MSLAAAPFIPSRHYLTSNDSIASKLFTPGTSLSFDTARSPDARSDPGAPTDQSLAPPTMPARADSRPDFVRGFGLDITEEVEEEEEEQYAEQHEENLLEGHEDEQAVAEASHIALAADDTIDMELDVDEADAEVGSITTAAQSRVHSRHVSRLSAALSLRSVNGNMGDSEAEAEREREGDPEDDAIGEWTGSEDLRTGAETAEDEVRKFLPRCFHAFAFVLTINLITPVPFFPLHRFFVLSHILVLSRYFVTFRRASASGQTHPTKNALVKNVSNVVSYVVRAVNYSKSPSRSPAASRTSRIHL